MIFMRIIAKLSSTKVFKVGHTVTLLSSNSPLELPYSINVSQARGSRLFLLARAKVGRAPAALNFAAETGWDTDQP